MKHFLLCLVLLVTVGPACKADFQAGLNAYKKGDYAAALKEWQPIAEQGDPNAQYNLGLLYAKGQGVSRDLAKAAEWYHKAADQGVPAAEYNLGVMYSNGEGVPQDTSTARKWFLKAAQKGIGVAQDSLGSIYDEGKAPQDYSEAEKWYRKAAEQGVARRSSTWALCMTSGKGSRRITRRRSSGIAKRPTRATPAPCATWVFSTTTLRA